jgi:hypothetical protein
LETEAKNWIYMRETAKMDGKEQQGRGNNKKE